MQKKKYNAKTTEEIRQIDRDCSRLTKTKRQLHKGQITKQINPFLLGISEHTHGNCNQK